MFIVGGKGEGTDHSIKLDVYDTETSQWMSFDSLQRYRHVAWAFSGGIFLHGGFGSQNSNLPVSDVYRIDILKTFAKFPSHQQRLKLHFASSPHPSRPNTPPMSPGIGGTQGGMAGARTPDTRPGRPNETPISPYNPARAVPNADRPIKVNIKPKRLEGVPENKGLLICDEFLNKLLKPKDYINYPEGMRFIFSSEQIIQLCDMAEDVIKKQPMILRFESPAMIFGDIHGQYSDLMRFFDLFGSPYDAYTGKDDKIQYMDYLFLGDFVDRGNHCLETICLLLALKVKYPEQIHLIRGNHEDRMINDSFGFSDELASRLDEDPAEPGSVFSRMNRLFEYLPLAAVIDEKILCLHGGIGQNLERLEQIEGLDHLRPLKVVHDVRTDTEKLVVDILWSDPTENDNELGILPNIVRDPDGTGNIVKFGPDIVKKFLKANNLVKIIRAHECVMDGMERFAGGDLITVFSATNYCGKHKNTGAVLCLSKNYEIMPKLIHPQNLTQNNWIEDEDMLRNRPPTPPRWRENS